MNMSKENAIAIINSIKPDYLQSPETYAALGMGTDALSNPNLHPCQSAFIASKAINEDFTRWDCMIVDVHYRADKAIESDVDCIMKIKVKEICKKHCRFLKDK